MAAQYMMPPPLAGLRVAAPRLTAPRPVSPHLTAPWFAGLRLTAPPLAGLRLAVPLLAIPLLAAAAIAIRPAAADAAELALHRVMLSSAGVGYFEYEAEVQGPAALGLDVPLEQVDDVLTSLVVFDSAGGVGTIELPGRDDSHAAFGDVPFTPETLRSPLDTLNALRGVELTVQGPRPMTGRLVHAESVAEPVPGTPTMAGTVPRTRVTLLCSDGLRQFVLEDADSVQVTDPALRERIGRAVAAARGEAGSSQRHLTLHSEGSGQRTVRVGFVAAAPLWKASYRLVLPDQAGADQAGSNQAGTTARLQGWAVLENQTASDWNGVALTLQYGNPVTFRQAIYRSYFVARPEVPVEILGHILPDVDTRARPAAPAGQARAAAAKAAGFAAAPLMAAPAPAPPPMAAPAEPTETAEAAEATTFQLATPLVLAAGHTAVVPIIDRAIKAERVDVAVSPEPHPRAALRITNDTGSSIPAGVMALYDLSSAAAFAGDARLGGLPPGETRLLEFAQDLRTAVTWHDGPFREDVVAVTAADGVLHATLRQRTQQRISLTAPETEGRHILLQIPRSGEQTLTVEDTPIPGIEETATAWRVPLTLAPRQNRTLVVDVDQLLRQDTVLLTGDDEIVLRLVNDQALNATARAALQHVLALRRDAAARDNAVTDLQRQLADVERDEDRIRRNLGAVAPADELHGKLTRALAADETRIDQIKQSQASAVAAADKAREALTSAITALRI